MKTVTIPSLLGLALTCLSANAAGQQLLESKSASFYKRWWVNQRDEVLGETVVLGETKLTCDFSAGPQRSDLRNAKGVYYKAPRVLSYTSFGKLRLPVTFFGDDYELVNIYGSAGATHGIHGNNTYYYSKWAKTQPSLSRSLSMRVWGVNQDLDPTFDAASRSLRVSTPTRTSTLYQKSWSFIVPPGIPITISGNVKLSWSLSAAARADGDLISSYFNGSFDTYLRHPETSLSLDHTANGYGTCEGVLGISELGVGVGHEIHICSPIKPRLSISNNENGMSGYLAGTIRPLLIKTWVVVRYLFGESKEYFPEASVALEYFARYLL